MNEIIFFIYIFLISTSLLIALKISKSALISLIALQNVLVNLFVLKEIVLFGFRATASDAFSVGITFGLNLIQEYYGKESAKKSIYIGFLCAIFYLIISQLHLFYVPDYNNIEVSNCYNTILSQMPRIIVASLFVYLITQNLDCILYGYFKKILANRYFILRNILSTLITQFIDTLLFSFLGLYKINQSFNDINIIIQIIIISYIIKIVAIFTSAIYISFIRKIVKKQL